MIAVTKRNGEIVDFNIQKIKDAIEKAFIAVNRDTHPTIIEDLAFKVTAQFKDKVKNGFISVEDIQDCVEEVLIRYDYNDVAKAYILYRKRHEDIRKTKETLLNYKTVVDNYLDVNSDANTTLTYSVGGLILSNSGAITANYWLNEVYDEEILNAHKNAEIHIHDLNMLTANSNGLSLKTLINKGIAGVKDHSSSKPPKHLLTLTNQMVNFMGIMQNEWSGAQTFSSFDTYLAPYVRNDNLEYKDVKQNIQSFIFGVNTPSRWGTQSPFSNITIDLTPPDDMKEMNCYLGGTTINTKYKDLQKEMNMINKALFEVLIDGDADHNSFKYPILTINVNKDINTVDNEVLDLLFTLCMKRGTPYFANFLNEENKTGKDRLIKNGRTGGGYLGSGEGTGSIGVVSINLPRIAYLADSETDFYERLDRLINIAARSLRIKRDTLDRFLASNLYPYTKVYLDNLNNHFSTISIVGMNEACLNARWLKNDLSDVNSIDFAANVLSHINMKLDEMEINYNSFYNLESTSSIKTSYRFAKHDKEKFINIITSTLNNKPYYTNSTLLPVGSTNNVIEALKIENNFLSMYTGGSCFFANFDKDFTSPCEIKSFVLNTLNKFAFPYLKIEMNNPHRNRYDINLLLARLNVNNNQTNTQNHNPNYNNKQNNNYQKPNNYNQNYNNQVNNNYQKPNNYNQNYNNQNNNSNHQKPNNYNNQNNNSNYQKPNNYNNQNNNNYNHGYANTAKREENNYVVRNEDDLNNINTQNNQVNNVNDVTTINNEVPSIDRLRLFTNRNDDNSRKAETLLDEAKLYYSMVEAIDNPEECAKYNVRIVPTLVVNGKDVYESLNQIMDYIESKL